MYGRILISLITSGLQTVIYYSVFYAGWTIGTMIYEPTRMTIYEAVGFGAYIKFSIVAFGIIMLALNLIDALANRRRWTWGLLISITIFYLIYWGQGINYIPYKTGMFLVTGVIAIYSKIPIEKLLNKLVWNEH
jgi:hypothetical protein